MATILLSLMLKELLDTDDLVINSLAVQFTQDQIQDVLNFQQKWQWVSYVVLPLLLLLKVGIIAAILDVGCFFFDREIKYKHLV
ncbi:MAG: hypothetical protein KAJ28_06865 [Flavobacteriaceae bacterium]|nr:hypothetical protein [Flavobacteriaceae bacterium]